MSRIATFDATDFRIQSGRFRDGCTVAVVIITIGLVLRYGLEPLLDLARTGDLTVESGMRRVLRGSATAAPAIFYACALWALRNTFARLAQGVRFEPALARGVGDAGADLLWGAITAALITPNVLTWTDGSPGGFDLGLDARAIVIGLVGAALTLLARLFARATAQEAELDEIV